MQTRSSQSWLLAKIEGFTRKYYFDKILKGTFIILGALLLYSLLLIIGEYFFYFKPIIKQIALFALIGTGITTIALYIIRPAFQLFKLSRRLPPGAAAEIIGQHFPDISDKLLNVLELSRDHIPNASRELIEASIQQKSEQFRTLKFTEAIHLKKNFKWLPWTLIPLLTGLIIYLYNPQIIHEPGQRLLLVNQAFEKPAPFDILLLNDNLETPHFSDYKLQIRLSGQEIPAEAFILINGEKISMQDISKHTFEFLIKRIDKDTEFRIEAAGFSSVPYMVKVIKKPAIIESKITLSYPQYLKKTNEVIYGFTDLTLPEGTAVTFDITTQFTDNNFMMIEGQPYSPKDNLIRHTFNNSAAYQYFLHNTQNTLEDSSQVFRVNIIKDAHPILVIQEQKDTISREQVVLSGSVSDDYGITRIAYTYTVKDASGKVITKRSKPLEQNTDNNISILHYEDIKSYGVLPGQQVEYYIEAWDNDGVNGPKYARSAIFKYQSTPVEKSEEELQHQNEAMSKSLAEGKEKLSELNKQIDKLKENSVQKNQLNPWEAQQNLQLLEEHQLFIQKKLEEVEKRLDIQKDIQEKKDYNDNIKEKQENIARQLNQMKDKELSEQMKKLQELLGQQNRQNDQMKMSDLEQMQNQNKMFEMSLERLEQMIKDLETQMKMEDLAGEINKIIEEQETLSEKTGDNGADKNALQKEQQEIQKKLDN